MADGSHAPYSQWCPPELTSAATPLRRSGELLKRLSDESKGLERFAQTSPSELVREAMAEFVDRWRLVLWQAGGEANTLGDELDWAATEYTLAEAELGRTLRVPYTDRFGLRP